uniref:Stum, mechanosensory transduction mediator homolog n=1 Tax=Rattus norvegicus TaxID=10116 RepID=A0ABK0L417_RAT
DCGGGGGGGSGRSPGGIVVQWGGRAGSREEGTPACRHPLHALPGGCHLSFPQHFRAGIGRSSINDVSRIHVGTVVNRVRTLGKRSSSLGKGTFVSAFTVLCGARTDLPDRHVCCVFWLNIAAALIQVLTAIVMVGWIMSIFWGMDMVILARYKDQAIPQQL